MYTFRLEDFEGCGQYLVKTKHNYIEETSRLTVSLYKVGYSNNVRWFDGEIENQLYMLIEMTDGLVHCGWWDRSIDPKNPVFKPFDGKQSFVDYLNDCGEYRPATAEEVLRVAAYQKARFYNLKER